MIMKKRIQDMDVRNKRVLLRCDFNVPVKDGQILDDSKIVAALNTIDYLVKAGSKIIILSHFGKVKTEEDKAKNSLAPIAAHLQKLINTNDFSMFANVDKEGLMKDLITYTQRPLVNIEQTRENYCNLFLSLLDAIPNTLIYIENFENIDESSLFILEQLFDHFDELNISYLISYDKTYSLHKKMHFMLSRPYYTEVTLTPTPFEVIVASDSNFYKNIIYYFIKYLCI